MLFLKLLMLLLQLPLPLWIAAAAAAAVVWQGRDALEGPCLTSRPATK
jgi:hypothetical protein